MSVSYTRISNINEKVKDASLTISQWRVLFAINENTYIEEIGDYVEESIDQIQDSIQALINEGLLVSSDATAPVEEKPAQPEEEPIIETESVNEDIAIEESEPEIVFADEPSEPDPETEESSEEIEIEDDDIEIEFDEEIEFEEEEVEVAEEETVEEAPEPEVVEEIEEEVTTPEPEAPIEEPSSGNSKKIMVVDESIVIRKMVEIAFEDLDYNVIGYSSGEDALTNAEAENVNIYIVDSALKDIKSTSLMNQIKEKKSAPVIMFCTKTNPQLAKEVEEAGCDGIVSKPFNDDDLINKVNELT